MEEKLFDSLFVLPIRRKAHPCDVTLNLATDADAAVRRRGGSRYIPPHDSVHPSSLQSWATSGKRSKQFLSSHWSPRLDNAAIPDIQISVESSFTLTHGACRSELRDAGLTTSTRKKPDRPLPQKRETDYKSTCTKLHISHCTLFAPRRCTCGF